MPTYQFEAMDTTGGEVKDAIEAANEEEAQQKIQQMGYFVTKITEVAAAKKGKKGKKKGQTQEGQGLRHRRRLQQGARAPSPASSPSCRTPACPCCAACKILEGQMKPGVLKNALIDVVDDIESGCTLSEAFAKHPKCFDRLYVNMIKAGEAGGALEVILSAWPSSRKRPRAWPAASRAP